MLALGELLAERELGLVLRTRERPDTLETRIRTAYVSELLDPRRYLTGGELVLTNGLWRDGSAKCDREYVARLAQAGVAVLGFGLVERDATLPEPLIESCEKSDLPLIEVPTDLSYADVIETVVFKAGRGAMREAAERTEAFLRQAAEGGGPASILRVLAREREVDAWLMRGQFVVAAAGRAPSSQDAELAWRAAGRAGHILPATFARADNTVSTIFRLPVTKGPPVLLIYGAPLQGISTDEQHAIDIAVSLLAFELAQIQAVRELMQAYAGELVELLMAGEPQLAALRARLEVLKLAGGILRVLVALSRLEEHSGGESEIWYALQTLADGALLAAGLTGVAAVRGSELVVLAILESTEAAHRFAEELRATVQRELPQVNLVVGLGQPVSDPEGLRSSFIQARYAARAAFAGRDAPVADSHRVGDYHALLELHPPELLKDFTDAVLGPLRQADERKNSSLIPTLAAFFGCGGRLTECAELLRIHPNTLRHRLDRVEHLTGRSLDNISDRVDLFLALSISTD